MNFITKLIAGSPVRKTRFHDEKGNLVPIDRLIRNGPRALLSGFQRIVLGSRPAEPWISYDAVRELKEGLPKNCRILEFGSGMSTIWYAKHASKVISVEDNERWYHLIKDRIRSFGNVDYRLARGRDEYTNGISGEFDLVMIDGSYRPDCVDVAIANVARSGIIYLDNSDKGDGGLTGDLREAENKLLRFAADHGWSAKYFVDFAPTQLFVQQGLMVRAPRQVDSRG